MDFEKEAREIAATLEHLDKWDDRVALIAEDLQRAFTAGETARRELDAKIVSKWLKPSYIHLHAGEMKAQELRSVIAVVRAVEAEILSHKLEKVG